MTHSVYCDAHLVATWSGEDPEPAKQSLQELAQDFPDHAGMFTLMSVDAQGKVLCVHVVDGRGVLRKVQLDQLEPA